MRKRFCSGKSDGNGYIALILMAIISLPIIGIYKIAKGNDAEKAIGVILLFVGIVIWIAVGVLSEPASKSVF